MTNVCTLIPTRRQMVSGDLAEGRKAVAIRRSIRAPALRCCGLPLPEGLGKYGCPNCEGENIGENSSTDPVDSEPEMSL